MQVQAQCVLCRKEDETVEHLFFKCQCAAAIWNALLIWLKIHRVAMTWSSEINWSVANIRGQSAGAHVFRMMLAACVYYIWHERNSRIFRNTTVQPDSIVRIVIQEMILLASSKPKLASVVPTLNYYPQM
ncbi:hypothetical protein P3S67_013212 [Capsicum chacoense]